MVAASILAVFAAAGCATRTPLPPPELPLTVAPDSELRRSLPEPWEARSALDALDVQTFELANGLRVALVERPQIPLVSVYLAIRGPELDARSRPGLAELTARVVNAATRLDGGDAMEAVRVGGVRPTGDAGPDGAIFGLSIASRGAKLAIHTLGQIVQSPTLSSYDVAAESKRMAEAAFDQARGVYAQALAISAQLVLGESHPLGTTPATRVAQLSAVRPVDVALYHRAYYHPESSALIVVGDATRDDVLAWAEESFGSWPRGLSPDEARRRVRALEARPPPPRESDRKRNAHALPFGAEQAFVFIPQPAVDARHPDRIPLELLALILGGGLESRANQALRHSEGLSYGVQTALRGTGSASYLEISTTVEQTKLEEGVRALDAVIERLQSEPVSEAELVSAQDAYLASLDASTNLEVASLLTALYLDRVEPTELRQIEQRVRSATVADLQRVARTYLRAQADIVLLCDYYRHRSEIQRLGARGIFYSPPQ